MNEIMEKIKQIFIQISVMFKEKNVVFLNHGMRLERGEERTNKHLFYFTLWQLLKGFGPVCKTSVENLCEGFMRLDQIENTMLHLCQPFDNIYCYHQDIYMAICTLTTQLFW